MCLNNDVMKLNMRPWAPFVRLNLIKRCIFTKKYAHVKELDALPGFEFFVSSTTDLY